MDPSDLSRSASALCALSSTGGAGGVLDVFYERWKLKVTLFCRRSHLLCLVRCYRFRMLVTVDIRTSNMARVMCTHTASVQITLENQKMADAYNDLFDHTYGAYPVPQP